MILYNNQHIFFYEYSFNSKLFKNNAYFSILIKLQIRFSAQFFTKNRQCLYFQSYAPFQTNNLKLNSNSQT